MPYLKKSKAQNPHVYSFTHQSINDFYYKSKWEIKYIKFPITILGLR